MNLSSDQLVQRLESELGGAAVSTDAARLAAHCVDGKLPSLVCAPASAEEISAVLRICAEVQAAIAPWGGGTAMGLGNPPRGLDVVLQTTELNKVIEHDAANLTATVQSGMVLSDLQKALAPQEQRAPFDPPLPQRSTVGGIVAANLNGPRRGFYGSVRDLVIGMKVALASGEVIKAGGKVVKNVAGYDMCKLFTGSLGTLGVVTEVTLRMTAIAEQGATIGADGTMDQTLQLAQNIANSPLLPTAVLLSSAGVLDDLPKAWRLTIRCEGLAETIARQVKDIQTMALALGMLAAPVAPQTSEQNWQRLCDFAVRPSSLVYRVMVPRAELRSILETASGWTPAATIVADVASALVWISFPANQAATGFFAKLIAMAKQRRGHAVMFAAPAALKAGSDVWGPLPPSLALMRKIKQQFDPQQILNPGRFLSGI